MTNKILAKEEKACEKHFEVNIRLQTGNYEVKLPLSDSADKLIIVMTLQRQSSLQ